MKLALPQVNDVAKVKAVRATLPADDVTADAVGVFLALSNPLRLRLVHALAHDELSVGDLAHALELSMSAVSHQLALLRHLKLVAARDDGRKTYYRVIDTCVARLVHDCLGHVGGEDPGTPPHHPRRTKAGGRRSR